jgi:tricorn protease
LPGEGDEEGEGADDENGEEESTPTRIDLSRASAIASWLCRCPNALTAIWPPAKDGALYYMDYAQPGAENTPPGESAEAANRLMRFDFEEREASTVQAGINGFILAADGETALFNMAGGGWRHGALGESLDLEGVSTSDMRLRVEPQLEWTHIFNEAWRMERAYFYDANLQGLDWEGVRARYAPLLEHVGRREDLNVLMQEMIGEMQAGHNNVGGGDVHRDTPVSTGMLGADFEIASNRYRIAKIYSGENWNPFLRGPLAAPGLGVSEGDFILAINGADLTASDNIFSRLQGLSGEQVTLTISSDARGREPRDVVIETISNEGGLRLWDWVEGNRRYVEEQTEGRVGYVYLPNTAGAGYDLFNRMYYAQANRDGIIFDERSNGGGQAADYITDVLSPFHLSGWRDRDGMAYNTPAGAHYGPKVMLIDQDAGSGGDYLPYSFRRRGVGPLIGTRTWGGLIGISANPQLIDGGFLTVPFFRFYTPEGEWTIENEGVAPDIEVQLDPVLYNDGQDSQLDRAIAETERLIEEADTPSVPLTLPEPPTEPGL